MTLSPARLAELIKHCERMATLTELSVDSHDILTALRDYARLQVLVAERLGLAEAPQRITAARLTRVERPPVVARH